MATKKKGKTAKKAAKKTAKKTGEKRERKRSARKKLPPYEPSEERIERFMHTLIRAGYLGKKIEDTGKERKRQAGGIRQMAETIDRQFRKFGG